MMLNVLSGYDIGNMSDVDRIHIFAEAGKQVYLHRDALFGDPAQVETPVEYLLSAEWRELARRHIDPGRAQAPVLFPTRPHKDTIYLCVVDRDGNSLSLINSLFEAFGSGILAPGSGVMLNNRGFTFNTEQGHPNCVAPRKRPMNTIIPGMLMREGEAVDRASFDGRLFILQTQGGLRLRAKYLLNCAGAWGAGIAAQFGEAVPEYNIYPNMLVTEPMAPFHLPNMGVVGGDIYARQVARGNVILGGGRGSGTLGLRANRPDVHSSLEALQTACAIIPALAGTLVIVLLGMVYHRLVTGHPYRP